MAKIELAPGVLLLGDKHYENIGEFYNSPAWPNFAAAAQGKILTILRGFKIYPAPREADFTDGFEFSPERGRVYFSSVDLAERCKFKIVPSLYIQCPGGLELFTKKFSSQYNKKGENAPVDRAVQLIDFDVNWTYEHYKGGSNGADIFRAGFDTQGRLAYLNPEYEPRKLNRLRRQLDAFGTEDKLSDEERASLRQRVHTGRRAFVAKVRKMIDPDNFLTQGEYAPQSEHDR